MNDYVMKRSEIIFLYDVKDANPNGDPLDENRPRIDEETGINLVTDVRLKRTVRDYLRSYKGQEIFVTRIELDDGSIQDGKQRADNFLQDEQFKSFNEKKKAIDERVLSTCIDIRLFGATIPVNIFLPEKGKDGKAGKKEVKGTIIHTGPVQFKMGRSMHKVFTKHFKGTGAFASEKDKTRETFREEDFLPYSLIKFYGIINENVSSETKLTNNDVELLMDGLWNGTKNLISRSKAGQMPRLLAKVDYINNSYHIGDLDTGIKLALSPDVSAEEEIRDIADIYLDVDGFIDTLAQHRDAVELVHYRVDPRVKTRYKGNEQSVETCLKEGGIASAELSLYGAE
jgi:CRISPR-associated protein Csh2